MLDKHTARALVGMGRMSSQEYLRLFGEELRSGHKPEIDTAEKANGNAIGGKPAAKAVPATSRACAGPQLPKGLTQRH